jgi:hypothetical protein
MGKAHNTGTGTSTTRRVSRGKPCTLGSDAGRRERLAAMRAAGKCVNWLAGLTVGALVLLLRSSCAGAGGEARPAGAKEVDDKQGRHSDDQGLRSLAAQRLRRGRARLRTAVGRRRASRRPGRGVARNHRRARPLQSYVITERRPVRQLQARVVALTFAKGRARAEVAVDPTSWTIEELLRRTDCSWWGTVWARC